MEQNFRLVTLNNKSRKGLYLYVKTGKNRGNYYKYNYDTPIDAYLDYDKTKKKTQKSLHAYKKNYNASIQKTTTKDKKFQARIKRKISQIKKRPQIKNLLKKGVSDSTIKNAYYAKKNTIQQAIKKALKPLVLDNKFLEILSQPVNVEQFKNRLEHRIKVTDKTGKELSHGNTMQKNTYNVIQEIQQNTKRGEGIEEGSKTPFYRKMKNLKYNMQHTNEGNIGNISVTIILRKG